MIQSSHLPQTIEKLLKVLDYRLPESLRRLVFVDCATRQRELRSDGEESLRLVLKSLVAHFDGCSGRSCYFISRKEAKPLKVSHIVEETGLSHRCVEGWLAFLKKHGLLITDKQVRKTKPTKNGMRLCASSCYRSLCDKLFAMLGILSDIIGFREYKANAEIKYSHDFILIGLSGALKGSRIHAKVPATSPPPKKREERPATDFASLLKARTGIDISRLGK